MRGGECPVIPPVHWKGVALPLQRSSRTLKTLSNCKGFYSVFSAVERFLYLRDFLTKGITDLPLLLQALPALQALHALQALQPLQFLKFLQALQALQALEALQASEALEALELCKLLKFLRLCTFAPWHGGGGAWWWWMVTPISTMEVKRALPCE